MADLSLKNKTIKGLIWSSVERFSVQGVQFFVMLVIARILAPKDFGLVGMLTIFIAVADSLISSGFSQALIRKLDRTENDYSTVFLFNIAVSFILYIILFAIAPWIAEFYDEPQLCDLMRILCLNIIIFSFGVVQRAIYTATVNFKVQAKASFIAALLSGIVGIWMAYKGFGVWTLVWQQLINASINTLLLWIYSSWRPSLLFSLQSFRELFSFGSKLMISGLIDTVYVNLYSLVIGKVFNATSLGYYTQADRFVKFPSSNISGIIQRVTYPVLCELQDDDEKLRKDYRILIKMSAFVVFPLMCMLAGIAYPLVDVLLGEKWLSSATLIIPLCFNMMFHPIAAINLNLLQVKGRSDLFLKLEIIKKLIGVLFIVFSIPFGVVFMCYSCIIAGLIMLYINTIYTKDLIGVGFWMQLKDIAITLAISFLMFVFLIVFSYVLKNVWLLLFVDFIFGVFFYVTASYRFSSVEFAALKSIMNKVKVQ